MIILVGSRYQQNSKSNHGESWRVNKCYIYVWNGLWATGESIEMYNFNSKISTAFFEIGSHWKGVPSNILHMSHGMYSFLMSFEHEPEFSNQR